MEPAGTGVATVATGDIARLANVGRAAVSNWRRRFPDFPTPVGGSTASPQYSLTEVTGWLTRHGRSFTVRPTDRLWQELRGATGDMHLGDRLGYVGGLLTLLARAPERWRHLADQPDGALVGGLADALRAVVPEIAEFVVDDPDEAGTAIVRLTAEVAQREDPRAVFDFLHERYLEVHSRRHDGTQTAHAHLLVRAADVSGGRVLDPACGTGGLLDAARDSGAVELYGQDVSRTAARLAAARLALHGAPARIVAADSLHRPGGGHGTVDAVICDPPFGDRSWGQDGEAPQDPRWSYGLPPRAEPELAWLQHCLAQVRPGGRVVILMPAAAASRRSGRRIRGNLLRAGVLLAVLSLPPTAPGATAADLWVLRRPDGEPRVSHVLVGEANTDTVLATLPGQAPPTGRSETGVQAVPIIDLLDEQVDLSPYRWLSAADPSEGYRPAVEQWTASVVDLLSHLPDLTTGTRHGVADTTTIGDLVRAGVLLLRQAPVGTSDVHDGTEPLLTAKDVRLGRPPTGRAHRRDGAVILQPGDLVTPLAPRTPVVRVITEAGALLGPRLYLLRVAPERIDPHFLAGFLRAGQGAGTSVGTSLAGQADLRRVRVPRLPLAAQRTYGDAFRRLFTADERLREVTVRGQQLVEQGFHGLGHGGLRPIRTATNLPQSDAAEPSERQSRWGG
ncbi:N-6 DNA methylase [Micromonospora sp. SH-82]|uniref:N-6 DNA methylase n=1 Tax=Micromonospora sp. SH-82 TaxID=3132938 RepID=UPI003EB6B772